jgi:hypothetical protein
VQLLVDSWVPGKWESLRHSTALLNLFSLCEYMTLHVKYLWLLLWQCLTSWNWLLSFKLSLQSLVGLELLPLWSWVRLWSSWDAPNVGTRLLTSVQLGRFHQEKQRWVFPFLSWMFVWIGFGCDIIGGRDFCYSLHNSHEQWQPVLDLYCCMVWEDIGTLDWQMW